MTKEQRLTRPQRKSIFKNLECEIRKADYSYNDLSKLTGLSVNAILERRKGVRDWNRKEMYMMKDILSYQGTIDELFQEDPDCVAYNLNILELNEDEEI